MKLQDTIDMMNSSDYTDRFKAEYFQLKIRLEKLADMLAKYKAGTLPFTPKCSYAALDAQRMTMYLYLLQLEKRADVEGISLKADIIEEHYIGGNEDVESNS